MAICQILLKTHFINSCWKSRQDVVLLIVIYRGNKVNYINLFFLQIQLNISYRLLYHSEQWIHTAAKIYKNTYNMNYVQMIN
jgi:hypothetical protein